MIRCSYCGELQLDAIRTEFTTEQQWACTKCFMLWMRRRGFEWLESYREWRYINRTLFLC